jgi:hypothetical protein
MRQGDAMAEEPAESSGSGVQEEREERYLGAGVAIGVAIGTALGAALDNVGVGVALGVSLGAACGAAFSEKKKPSAGKG